MKFSKRGWSAADDAVLVRWSIELEGKEFKSRYVTLVRGLRRKKRAAFFAADETNAQRAQRAVLIVWRGWW